MSWLLIVFPVWMAVAVAAALLIGRSIRVRDERDDLLALPPVPDHVPAEWAARVHRGR